MKRPKLIQKHAQYIKINNNRSNAQLQQFNDPKTAENESSDLSLF